MRDCLGEGRTLVENYSKRPVAIRRAGTRWILWILLGMHNPEGDAQSFVESWVGGLAKKVRATIVPTLGNDSPDFGQ
jgi:hypothetical protein